MHVARGDIGHSRIARKINALEGRARGGHKLSIPLPSIPIVSPLLSPLLTPPIDPQQPTPTPAPQPSNGGGSGNGSGSGTGAGTGNGNGGSTGGTNPSNGGGTTPTSGGSSGPAPTSSGNGETSPSGSGISNNPSTTGTPTTNLSNNTGMSNQSGNSYSVTKTGGIIGSSTSAPTGTSLDGTSGPSSPNAPDLSSASGGGTSQGAIAGITVVVILALLALMFFIRRRSILLRRERRHKWWNRVGFGSAPRESYHSEKDGRDSPAPGSRASFRSSFATTVDHAQTPRDASPEWIMIPPALPGISGSNKSGAQYPHAPPSPNIADSGTPMSVPPSSLSESFAFPPVPKERTSPHSAEQSRASLMPPTTNKTATQISPVPPTFVSLTPNPFADPVHKSPSPVSDSEQAQFAEIETIRRPFQPSRPDEIAVSLADKVKVLQVFNDGWVVVERMPSAGVPQESFSSDELSMGLIPVDCFRPVGQDLPTFFDEKRVSSLLYAESVVNPFE